MSLSHTPPSSININSATKRPRTTVENTVGDSDSITLDSAVQMLMRQFKETKTMIDEMRSEINSKIEAVKTDLQDKLNVVSNDIHTLRSECVANFKNYDVTLNDLHGRVDGISTTVNNLENRNELIISGILYIKGEDLLTLLHRCASGLNWTSGRR